jgi:hypothetical protein
MQGVPPNVRNPEVYRRSEVTAPGRSETILHPGGSYRPALSRPATNLSETVTLFRKRPVFAAAAARPLTEVDSDAMD